MARRTGAGVVIWALEPEVVEEVNRDHRNSLFLPSASLDPGITATSSLTDAVSGADVLLLVPPAQHIRRMSAQLAEIVPRTTHILVCSKGIEQATGQLMTQVTDATLPRHRVSVLSGPTFAHELAAGMPAAVTIASHDESEALAISETLRSQTFKPYATGDVIGAQIGGAIKNVLAIATGMAAGLELGENMRAALITRGLAEMVRLGLAIGGRAETLMGLSGMGDLVLTCSSIKSRNMSLGVELAKGRAVADVLGERRSVAEGYYTAPAVMAMAREKGIEMPISEMVHSVLYEGADARESIRAFGDRAVRPEWG
jgi:glycerol-3-phosphate dehydrogenase (NAD(P)+)